ncbi:MAG TPA: OHCU decarboxylase, partial [Oceanospirillales bacterium]|nr:OHCU decarboxylase [Oceanospirillales bacterium]
FGFIFIVFATGKSAAEMLDILKERLPNPRDKEIQNAADNQQKITALRLKKMLGQA